MANPVYGFFFMQRRVLVTCMRALFKSICTLLAHPTILMIIIKTSCFKRPSSLHLCFRFASFFLRSLHFRHIQVPSDKSVSESVSLTTTVSLSVLLELDELVDDELDPSLLGGTRGTNLSLSILSTSSLNAGSFSPRFESSR